MWYWMSRSGLLLLVWAAVLQAEWGITNIVVSQRLKITPTGFLLHYLSQPQAGLLLLGASLLAGWGLFKPGRLGFYSGILQNGLLWSAFASGLYASLTGHYADLVPRPFFFIFNDQLAVMLAAPLHLLSMIVYHGMAEATSRDA